jgi:DNA end-binding protein Ku
LGTPVWKGRLAVGRLAVGSSFAIKILTGARAESISFNQLHGPDLSRVKTVLYCDKEDKPIPREELVKGYEYAKGEYIAFDAAEIKALAPDPPDVIELKKFIPLDQVDPLYFESSYYVVPDDDAEAPYAALYGALRRTSLAGVQTVCLYSRERPLLFRAGSTGIVAHSLLYQCEIRALDQFRTVLSEASESQVAAAARAIKALATEFGEGFDDLQRERTRCLIEAKVAERLKPAVKGGRRSRTAA